MDFSKLRKNIVPVGLYLIKVPFQRALSMLLIVGVLAIVAGVFMLGMTLFTPAVPMADYSIPAQSAGRTDFSNSMSIEYDEDSSRWILYGDKTVGLIVGVGVILSGAAAILASRYFRRELRDITSQFVEPSAEELTVTRIKAKHD